MRISDALRAYVDFRTKVSPDQSDASLVRHFGGFFGHLRLSALTDAHVEQYIARRTKDGARPGSVRRELKAVQAALNMASGRKFRLPKPPESPRRDRWLTEDQERDFLHHLADADRDVWLFAKLGLTYGVRKGAIMDLRFGPMVDFEAGVLDFNVPGRRETNKRRPVVPMTGEIRAELASRHQVGRVLPSNTPYKYGKFARSIGYGWVTPHVLKHTAISLMLRGGAKIEDVAALTATDIRTLAKTYRHHTVQELLTVAGRRA